ncbi:E3 ubiquitin-protein ligase rnf8-like isoform X2 [Physella acuta]|uniref:E3 ubiquitin-protein ligase rnf8-like isoform X2 n=1 Tax=Physella acuta TaxID=109671 RepID=UPI0027DBE1DB|nr:E3 ubiquitin-protein ligase rnf8-like isoform X2 [Physella acuta]
MTEIFPCFVRIGDRFKKYKLLKLDKTQVTIGRSCDVTYCILSDMISRCHATIRQLEDNTWTITDNKSLNGVYVNGRLLTPDVPYTLQEGDMVQLGVPTSPGAPAEFLYKFHSSLKFRIEGRNHKKLKTDPSCTGKGVTPCASEIYYSEDDEEMKRKGARKKFQADSPNKSLRDTMEESRKLHSTKEVEYLARLAEMEKLLQEKEQKQKEVQEQLEQERKEKENQAKEVAELKLKEIAILLEMQDKQEQLEKEKNELKIKMQEELEANLREREAVLLGQLAAQRESLLKEKEQIEGSLQKEMAKVVEEKNKELEQQLLDQKLKLEKILEKKDMEQKILESQLNETKEESASAKMQALKAREDVLSNFVDLMEMELQCSICNELFIKATSLNCSHVFCKLCISQWTKMKKECPNCRTYITSQTQALALDNYIDKMVEQLSEDLKKQRKTLIDQRKIEQEKFEAIVAGPSTAPRGRGARRRATRGTRQWTVTRMPFVQHPPTTSTYNGVSLGNAISLSGHNFVMNSLVNSFVEISDSDDSSDDE